MASLVTRYVLGRTQEVMLWDTVFCAVCLSLLIPATARMDVVYFSSHCNSTVEASDGGLIEPDSVLHYKENIDCTMTLAAQPTHKLFLQFHRFVLEGAVNGRCPDSLTVYDGDTVNSKPLTPELCGRLFMLPNVISTGNNVTFRFKTDESGRALGFGIYYTQFTEAPCSDDQFECNNNRCIDQSLTCDTINMCGDWSDEGNCTVIPPETPRLSLAAIAGITVSAMVFLAVVVFALVLLGQHWHERKMLKELEAEVDQSIKENPYSKYASSDNSRSDFTVFSRKRTSKVSPEPQ